MSPRAPTGLREVYAAPDQNALGDGDSHAEIDVCASTRREREALDLIPPRRAARGRPQVGRGRAVIRRLLRRPRLHLVRIPIGTCADGARVLQDMRGAGMRGRLQSRVRLRLPRMGRRDSDDRRRHAQPMAQGCKGGEDAGLNRPDQSPLLFISKPPL